MEAIDKNRIRKRANYCCEYCRCPETFSPTPYSIEHIKPTSKGGDSHPSNLAFACQGCNNHKYNHISSIDPVSGHEHLLFNPREDVWIDHFNWSVDYSKVIGISPRGRATIERLKLNRKGVVNLRKVLHLYGFHPKQ